jgi:hypothetical protein
MRFIQLAAIVAACLFCLRADAQCQDGRCYRPAVSTASTLGKVIRRWQVNADGTRTLLFDASKESKTAAKPASSLMPGEVNRDPRAYDHAKREAQMLANSGRGGWHPLGTAPGCSFSGCGQSTNGVPNHCYVNQSHRLIARAGVYRNGRWYWSAHFR